MPQFSFPGVGAEPAAAPVGKRIHRRKQPRLAAELLGIIFRIVVLFQKGHLWPGQAQQAFLLISGDADVMYRIGWQCFLVLADGADLAVPLDITFSADWKSPQHPLFRAAGDLPCEQIYIGFLRAQDTHLHSHPLQLWNSGVTDKVPVFRHLT